MRIGRRIQACGRTAIDEERVLSRRDGGSRRRYEIPREIVRFIVEIEVVISADELDLAGEVLVNVCSKDVDSIRLELFPDIDLKG